MKILFAVPYVPSLVRVRPYNLIRGLAARGHDVTVATVWTNDGELEELRVLQEWCAEVHAFHLPRWRSLVNCLAALPGREPLQARYSWSRALAERIESVRSGFDVMHVEHLRGARYGLSGDRSAVPVVWDSVDCISDLFERAIERRPDAVGRSINRLELARTRRYEGRLASRFDRVLITSPVDRASLLSLAESVQSAEGCGEGLDAAVAVLPNGVDLDYFTPSEAPRDAETLVFSGKMSYHANESAALHLIGEVMPRIWSRRPATRVVIAGRDPSRTLQDLASRHAGRVILTGAVADIRPHLRGATVAAAPLVYGAGCQNKVLEAMACATPVVTTPQAVAALEATPGRDVVVADGTDAFARSVLELMDQPARRRALGAAGRRYVESRHRWDAVAKRLEGLYAEAIEARRARRSRSAPAPVVNEVSYAPEVSTLR